MLLAVDAALKLGGAWGAANASRPYTAVIDYPRGEFNFNRAIASARQWTAMMVKSEGVKIVLVEAAMQKVDRDHSAYSALLLMSLQAVICEAATAMGAEAHRIDVHTWRHHFIGNGNMPGDQAKRATMKRCDQLGYRYQDHNAAEAAGLWDFGIHTFCRRSSLFAR